MKHPTILTLLFAIGLIQPTASPTHMQDPAAKIDFNTEIFHAVLEGLYDDGVSNETADLLLRKQDDGAYTHFISGCPTCVYVLEALRHYRARPDFVSFKMTRNTWGLGLDKGSRERLKSEHMKVRIDVLHTLVTRWMDKRMDRLRLNKRERKAWHSELKRRAKKGMGLLTDKRNVAQAELWADLACPSCEGAVAASGRE